MTKKQKSTTNIEKTLHSEKRQEAVKKAQTTASWAKTMTKVVIAQNNGSPPFWHVVNFLGPGKAESRGIVDLIAIRKNQTDPGLPLKRGDFFEIVLIQVKGGSAKLPSTEDRERLRLVGEEYKAKEILLSEWKKGSMPVLFRLADDKWVKLGLPDVANIFGPRRKSKSKEKSNVDTLLQVMGSSAPAESSQPANLKTNAADKAWVTRRASQSVK